MLLGLKKQSNTVPQQRDNNVSTLIVIHKQLSEYNKAPTAGVVVLFYSCVGHWVEETVIY